MPKPSEDQLASGKHSLAVRKTFEKARPILDRLKEKYPRVNETLILGCLKRQTIVAETWPTEVDRKKRAAYKKLCHAWIEFCAAANQTPTLVALRGIAGKLARAGHTTHDPEYLYREFYKKWPPFFQDLQTTHDLPAPEAIGSKGRPTSWWSDSEARRLADHFRGKTGGSPRWTLISELLKCAPLVPGLLMSPGHIRQRLNRWNRDKQQTLMMKLASTRER